MKRFTVRGAMVMENMHQNSFRVAYEGENILRMQSHHPAMTKAFVEAVTQAVLTAAGSEVPEKRVIWKMLGAGLYKYDEVALVWMSRKDDEEFVNVYDIKEQPLVTVSGSISAYTRNLIPWLLAAVVSGKTDSDLVVAPGFHNLGRKHTLSVVEAYQQVK